MYKCMLINKLLKFSYKNFFGEGVVLTGSCIHINATLWAEFMAVDLF